MVKAGFDLTAISNCSGGEPEAPCGKNYHHYVIIIIITIIIITIIIIILIVVIIISGLLGPWW